MFLQKVHSGKNDFWRYVISILIVMAGFVIGQLPLMLVVWEAVAGLPNGTELMLQFSKDLDFRPLGISANTGFLLILLSFVAAMLALWLCVTQIHLRPFRSLISAVNKVRWGRVGFAFGLWMLFTILLEGLNYWLAPHTYVWQFELRSFLPLLVISLLILPIQTSFEELFFRGYLLQALSLVSQWRCIPLLVTSALFAFMHSMNPELEHFGSGLMLAYYAGFGLFAAILTLLDDGLELAMGVHAATNIFGATMVTFDGSALQTSSLLRAEVVNVPLILAGFVVLAGIFIFLCIKWYRLASWTKVIGPVAIAPSADSFHV